MAGVLPSGRVTFAFVDVVDSTRLFSEHGDAFVTRLETLQSTIRELTEQHGGAVVKTEGDGAFLAFGSAAPAVEALLALHHATEVADGPLPHLRIRTGAHTGAAVPVAGDYVALAVNVAARVSAAARDGQVLVTDDTLPPPLKGEAVEAGTYVLKGISDPVVLWRLAGDERPPNATPYRRTNVADSRTSFIGRADDLTRLRAALGSPGLVTLLGPGGVGKTRISHELALADRETWPGGAWMAELAPVSEKEGVLEAVGAALGLESATDVDVQAELVRRGRTLLVVDNCEHLLDPAAELVDALLMSCPELSVLATSRESLEVIGEQVVRLSPLSTAESAELFRQRAEVAVDEEVLVEISELLDGLPLAVELAAPYAARLSVADLRDLVSSSAGRMSRRSGPERQRDLEALVRWSLDRLDPAERDALLALSVFPGRFTGAMARYVLARLGDAPAALALADLVAKSLVDVDGEEYRLLVTIRAVTSALLAEQPELRELAADGLLDWAQDFADERHRVLTQHDDVSPDVASAALDALDYAETRGRTGTGTLWHFVSVLAFTRVDIGTRSLPMAEVKLTAVEWDRTEDSLTQLSAAAVILVNAFGRQLPSGSRERLLQEVDAFPDSRAASDIHGAITAHHLLRDELAQAKEHAEESARIVEGDDGLTGLRPVAWGRLALIEYLRGHLEGAIALSVRGRDLDLASATPRLALQSMFNLAELYLENGQVMQALSEGQQALALAATPRDRGFALACISWALAALERQDEARQAAEMAIDALEPYAANAASAEALERTGRVLAELG